MHPLAEVAIALRQSRQMPGPDTAGDPRMIGRHSQDQLPARIVEPPDQSGGLMPEPPGGIDHADVSSQTCLHPAGAGLLQHQNDVSVHAK